MRIDEEHQGCLGCLAIAIPLYLLLKFMPSLAIGLLLSLAALLISFLLLDLLANIINFFSIEHRFPRLTASCFQVLLFKPLIIFCLSFYAYARWMPGDLHFNQDTEHFTDQFVRFQSLLFPEDFWKSQLKAADEKLTDLYEEDIQIANDVRTVASYTYQSWEEQEYSLDLDMLDYYADAQRRIIEGLGQIDMIINYNDLNDGLGKFWERVREVKARAFLELSGLPMDSELIETMRESTFTHSLWAEYDDGRADEKLEQLKLESYQHLEELFEMLHTIETHVQDRNEKKRQELMLLKGMLQAKLDEVMSLDR